MGRLGQSMVNLLRGHRLHCFAPAQVEIGMRGRSQQKDTQECVLEVPAMPGALPPVDLGEY